jgi:hypothetical protein
LRERVMDSAGTPIKEWFLELGVDYYINTMTYFGLSYAVKLFHYWYMCQLLGLDNNDLFASTLSRSIVLNHRLR